MSRGGDGQVEAGTFMGIYRIIRRLVAGSVSEVFLAAGMGADGLAHPVLIERLLPSFSEDGIFVDLFLGSARTSATLRSANVVRVLGAGVSGGHPCRLLELVDGEELGSLCTAARARGLTLGLREVCFIVLQVAEGLACLHRARPVHRGLHPSHVWISLCGEVKLLDTGGATRSDPPYLTPEQVRGRPADPRGDVFRLGLLLYELLAGRPLFDGSPHPQVLHHIGAFDERDLEPLPGCPPSLWTVLLQAIATEPEARFPSARAFADTLRHFLLERQLGVDHFDIAHLFARLVPERRSFLEEQVEEPRGEGLSLAGPASPHLAAMPHTLQMAPWRRRHEKPPPVLYPVTLPPPLDAALGEASTRLLDEALVVAGGSAEVAPLLVRLTHRCVARMGGCADEEKLAVMGARALVLAARLEEHRRFVLPSLAGVRALVDGSPVLSGLLAAVLLAGRDSGPPDRCAARALLCAAAFAVQVQSAEPGAAESIRALVRLRQDPRIDPSALEALTSELGVGTAPSCVSVAG